MTPTHWFPFREPDPYIYSIGASRGGGRFKCYLSKRCFFCTDLLPITLYRKCIKFAPKKGWSSDPSDPPLPTPLLKECVVDLS